MKNLIFSNLSITMITSWPFDDVTKSDVIRTVITGEGHPGTVLGRTGRVSEAETSGGDRVSGLGLPPVI